MQVSCSACVVLRRYCGHCDNGTITITFRTYECDPCKDTGEVEERVPVTNWDTGETRFEPIAATCTFCQGRKAA